MRICAQCKKEVKVDKNFSRKSVCQHCGEDLHICLNCRFYSVTSHNKCLETKAEFQRTRDRANFCDYFKYREGGAVSSKKDIDPKEQARKMFDDLFRK
jgi:plasmid rolling circle replication initiator protein Rep